MIVAWRPTLVTALLAATSAMPAQRMAAPPSTAATRVMRFVVPSALPTRGVAGGECSSPSTVASYRADTVRCTAGTQVYDPCFRTSRADRVICEADPRDASRGLSFGLATPLAVPPLGPERHISGVHVWFFELSDGTTCRPLTGTGREVEGLSEIYTCQFAMPGSADAVLGDLDASSPVWTIQQVLINKKIEPPTIKSTIIVTVKSVWQ